MQQQQQQAQSAPSQQPPPAPSMNSRPPNFRNNDPRFKHQEKAQADAMVRPDQGKPSSTTTVQRLGDLKKKKNRFGDGRFGEDDGADQQVAPPKAHSYEDAARDPDTASGSMSLTAVDPFGRTRDWKERTFGNRTPNTTPRSSPMKQKAIKSLSSSPQKEKVKATAAHLLNEYPKPPSTVSISDKKSIAQTENSSSDAFEINKTSSGALATSPNTGEAPRSKPEELPPLLMSLLGDQDVIKRAEAAVQHLSEVISNPSMQVRRPTTMAGLTTSLPRPI
jgi:hypothetical protein